MGYHLYNRATSGQRTRDGEDWLARPGNYRHIPFTRIHLVREMLLRLGMAYDVSDFGFHAPNSWTGAPGQPPFTFPDAAAYGLAAYRDPDGTTLWEGERLAEFHAARAYVLALHLPVAQPGIPLHKLGAPDGWIVTAAECRDALTAFHKYRHRGGTYPAAAFGDSFITFLTACADGDGFLVT